MSSRTDLRVTRSLHLLRRLHQTVADFSKREELLLKELRTRRANATRKHRDAMTRASTGAAEQTNATQAHYDAEEERLRFISTKRRARVQHTYAERLRTLPKRAQEAKQKWMGDLQMRHFRAERLLSAELKAADEAEAHFATELTAERSTLAGLVSRARRAFRGYSAFQKMLLAPPSREVSAAGSDHHALLEEFRARLKEAEEQLEKFRRFLVPNSFSEVPLSWLVLPIVMIGVTLAILLGANSTAYLIAAGAVLALLIGTYLLHQLGQRQSAPTATAVVNAIVEASAFDSLCTSAALASYAEERRRAQAAYDATSAEIAEQWNQADDVEESFERRTRLKLETQTPRILGKLDKTLAPKVVSLEEKRDAHLRREQEQTEALKAQLRAAEGAELGALSEDERAQWDAFESEWEREISSIYAEIEEMNAATREPFPPWSQSFVEAWTRPTTFSAAAKFAQIELDLAKHAGRSKETRLALPGPEQVAIPVALTFPEQGSLLFETSDTSGVQVTAALNNIIFRLLSTTPPGKLSFTIIDPAGLGENFAGLMHLSDYEESLINRRIWTQRDQIEDRLAELSEHVEKVIQMYLRNEYATITEYNEQAGSVAEKYHFLVISDFPAGFSETAAKRLQSIAASGPRCGIFTLIHWDTRHQLPDGFAADDLRKNSVRLKSERGEFVLGREQQESGAVLNLDPPPTPELAVELVHKIGQSSIDSNRVEVPFAQIAPKPEDMWTADTTTELRVAIGRTGATKHQYLAIGKGTRQHALFAGKTGSGKSTLFHVIITNLALACSPEQVEFYLIDFKKGVEFKCYATKRLPHARVIAIESDREFALSVLQRVDEELKRRGDMFRKLGVQDIAGYKKAGGTEPVPRTLLMIDEFQEFFVEDDTIAQTASLLFDRIVRQGRAFGIHVLLGSQSLGGAYSLARATIGQMVIRVALQCNEADAYLIMDDTNSAPRLLSRPGEGIYNDAGGAIEGNSPFQVVWLPDDERDERLEQVRTLADARGIERPGPIVFEGNAPADLRENELLRVVLAREPASALAAARAWLGAPNSIKGPTEAVFQRQSGNHLLIVGQRDEASGAMLGLSLLALAAQYPAGGARFYLFQASGPGSADAVFIERIVAAAPQEITTVEMHQIGEVMNTIATDLKARSSGDPGADGRPVFICINGLHRFKKLRQEDEFSFSMSSSDEGPNSGAQLNEIITEGSSHGIHLLVTIDTFNNVNRAMSRKALSEFEMRVVFQMSASDSASLIDSPKASGLGLHRALYYNEHQGTLETFRPYALPDAEWLREIAEKRAQTAVENG